MIVLRELAPAKVNLYLHITGVRADGYHFLDSLTGFASVADKLEAAPAGRLTLTVQGAFAHLVPAQDNSVLRAAEMLRAWAGITTGAALVLHKQLPVAAGLGGGSADAAAALRLLMRFWNVRPPAEDLMAMALKLGADVSACLRSTSLYMSGIGERVEEDGPPLSGIHLVLVNPGAPLKTPDVFAGVKPPYSSAPRHPQAFASLAACAEFLNKCRNDLQEPAMRKLPEIAAVLEALREWPGCLLARMSGSGATCFGVFAQQAEAQAAAAALGAHAQWWVREAVFL